MQLDPLVILIACGVLIAVFVRAIWHKLSDFDVFKASFADYELLPQSLVAPAALVLVLAEAAIVAGLVSIPMTFFTSNDAFFFGILPILSEAAGHYGISPLEMARASIIGQPLHQSSPLVPSFLLLCGLAKVELGEHSRKTIWRAIVVSLVMLAVGGLTGAYPL